LEILPALAKFGQDNLAKYNFSNAEIKEVEDRDIDMWEDDQYDKILVSASSKEIPESLLNRLRVGGTMVIPAGNSIFKISKNEDGEIDETEYPGFNFVPLV
jgi:protein-L-isoaspartate(D-aspartate) O-methyltransferase